MNDNELLEHLRAGRYNKAIKRLYQAYPAIRQWVMSNNGKKEDAEDIFQETLLILCRKVKEPGFTLHAKLDTFIHGIAKNLWYNELRKHGKIMLGAMPGEDGIAAEAVRQESLFSVAEQAFIMLGEKCRELLILFYIRKKPMAEIARTIGLSNEKVAKNQKYRCLEKAKEHYANLKNNPIL